MSRLVKVDEQYVTMLAEGDVAAQLLDWRIEKSLREPESRLAWDVLPSLIKERSPLAERALLAIARDAHRGWLDTLLSLERDAADQGLVRPWVYALESCLGQDGPLMADGDVSRALQRAARRLSRAA